MRINHCSTKINFKKRLMAECFVLRDKKPMPCTISLLEDKSEDREYLSKVKRSSDWKNSFYLQWASNLLGHEDYKIYVLEDKQDNCMAFLETSDRYEGFTNIYLFESMPSRKSKKIKYLGETMINFLAQITNETNKKLTVQHSADRAKKFYKKCKFKDTHSNSIFNFVFHKQKLEKLKKQNRKHTGSPIEFVI